MAETNENLKELFFDNHRLDCKENFKQGFAMGMNNAYMSIGSILGPMIAGSLFDVNIIYPFVLGFVILSITLVISLLGKNKAYKKIAKVS